MKVALVLLMCLGLARISFSLPVEQSAAAGQGEDQQDGQSQSQDDQSEDSGANQGQSSSSQKPKSSGPAPSGSAEEVRAISLQRPDNIAEYLQNIRRPGLRMTVDTVDEGFKKKNKNSFQDPQISIKDKNSTTFSRTGQVQKFEGPNFNLRTALLRENTADKSKTHVVTAQDSEKNFTRKNDRLTQFVGTLDTDQFSAGALLTDHSNRGVMGSVRKTADGNQESRHRKQNTNNIVRGSFLKAANLSINSRFQSDSFSNRERLVSDIVLGDSGASSGDDSQDE